MQNISSELYIFIHGMFNPTKSCSGYPVCSGK